MSRQSFFYQELQQMLERPGCPVCQVGRKASNHYLENLLWGSVNDPEIRQELNEAMGFCSLHSRDLLSFEGERLGTAIIEQALLKEGLRRLQRAKAPADRGLWQRLQLGGKKNSPGNADSAMPSKGSCPVCDHMRKLEKRSLEELLAHLPGDLDEPLQAAGGLCWDHLAWAMSMPMDAQTATALVELHSEEWKETIGNLGEFIRKRDYRFSHEPISDQEGESIRRAIAILTGEYPEIP
ncbi:MAG: DUF6062 family protein [Chloroflexota bacterium]|nr:DUF6062 family protein [Chloroflexota bacterium]